MIFGRQRRAGQRRRVARLMRARLFAGSDRVTGWVVLIPDSKIQSC
jgi:hypothetical protein